MIVSYSKRHTGLLLFLFLLALSLPALSATPTDSSDIILVRTEIEERAKLKDKDAALQEVKRAEQLLKGHPQELEELSRLYLFAGTQFYRQGWSKHAKKFYEMGIEIRLELNLGKDSTVGDLYHNLAFIHEDALQLDEAILLYKKGLEYRIAAHGRSHLKPAQSYHNLSITSFSNGDLFKAIEYQEESLKIKKSLPVVDEISLARGYALTGVFSRHQGNHHLSIQVLDTALHYAQKYFDQDDPFILDIESYKSHALHSLGRYNDALILMTRTLGVFQKEPDKYALDIVEIQKNLATVHVDLGNLERSLQYTRSALDILQKVDPAQENYRWAYVKATQGQAYLHDKQWSKALRQYKSALAALKKTRPNNPDMGAFTFNVGAAYAGLKDYSTAKQYYEAALQVWKKYYGEQHHFTASGYHHLITVYQELGDLVKAESYIKLALEANRYRREDLNATKSLSILWSTLTKKGALLKHRFEQTEEISLLKEANRTFLEAIRVIEHQKRLAQHEDFSINSGETYHKLFEHAISTNYLLFQETGDRKYLKEAFTFSEKSKAITLLEGVKTNNALSFAGIPAHIVKEEAFLRNQINIYKLEIARLEQSESPIQTLLNTLSSEMYSCIDQHQALVSEIEDKYPNFYKLRYVGEMPDIKTIQGKLLQKKQVVIEYFLGEESLYAFKIQKKKFELFKIDHDFNRSAPIKWFIHKPQSSGFIDNPVLASQATYAEQAHFLYQKLIAPLQLKKGQQLIIIPDAELGYIPFEALLTDRPEASMKFNEYNYLLYDHVIKYCYSMSLYEEMSQASKQLSGKNSFFGVGLSFENAIVPTETSRVGLINRSSITPLRSALAELRAIHDLMGGDTLVEDEATKAAILSRIENYQIIHFVTHGFTYDDAAELSHLVLSYREEDKRYERLYLQDIYNMILDADLVVMSACKTADGKLKKGEGIMSLARAFSFAGARNVIPSLWEVSDASSKRLMELFYVELQKGKPIEAALSSAKQQFIKNVKNPMLCHPYHWAAFIDIGGTPKKRTNWWFLALAFTPVLFVWLRRRKATNN